MIRMRQLDIESIKKEIGQRFKKFREAMGKTQVQLAKELGVYQSTITNIEVGKTFPGIKYLHYFHIKYSLNINWIVNNSGGMLTADEEIDPNAISILYCHIPKDSPKFQQYLDLMLSMQNPIVEQVVLAKVLELKALAKGALDTGSKEKQKKTG